jgi:hypothetical protein
MPQPSIQTSTHQPTSTNLGLTMTTLVFPSMHIYFMNVQLSSTLIYVSLFNF